MGNSIAFTATAAYGETGQIIGIVTGTDPRFGLALDFVGTKEGKRRETTRWHCAAPALVVVRSVKKGRKEETYTVVWDDDGSLRGEEIVYDQAIALARGTLGAAALAAAAKEEEARQIEDRLAKSADRDGAEIYTSSREIYGWDALGLELPCTLQAVRDARLRRLAHLRGTQRNTPSARRDLEDERARLVARIAEIDAILARDLDR